MARVMATALAAVGGMLTTAWFGQEAQRPPIENMTREEMMEEVRRIRILADSYGYIDESSISMSSTPTQEARVEPNISGSEARVEPGPTHESQDNTSGNEDFHGPHSIQFTI